MTVDAIPQNTLVGVSGASVNTHCWYADGAKLGRLDQFGLDWPSLIVKLREAGERHDSDGSFPHDNLARLQQAELLGLTVPVELGGQGRGLAASSDVVGLVAEGCPSTALILAMQLSKQAALARNTGYPAAVRERIGREAVREGALFNSIRVEPPSTDVLRGVASFWKLRKAAHE